MFGAGVRMFSENLRVLLGVSTLLLVHKKTHQFTSLTLNNKFGQIYTQKMYK